MVPEILTCEREKRKRGRPKNVNKRLRDGEKKIKPTLKNFGLVTPPLLPSPSQYQAPCPSRVCPFPLKVTSVPEIWMRGPSQ
jgi:hypothetical protein